MLAVKLRDLANITVSRRVRFALSRSRYARPRVGFTLLEGMIAIALLLILASLSALVFTQSSKNLRLKSAASEINGVLQTARIHAIAQNKYHQVVLYFSGSAPDSISYWIDQIDSSGNIEKPKIITPKMIPEFVTIDRNDPDFVIQSDLAWNTNVGDIKKIVFQPDGTSDFAQIQLKLTTGDPGDRKNYYTIILFAPTARSKIFPMEKKEI